MTAPDGLRIGFCGLGLMGSAMVTRLLRAGHAVTVWNRSPAKAAPLQDLGAQLAPDPAAVARDCTLVILCLTDEAAVLDVTFGPAGLASQAGVGALRCVLDHSSISPEATRRIAQRLRTEAGADWLDAPVSGGVAGAQAGRLAVMAGGNAEALSRCTLVMQAYARQVTRMGSSGAGQLAKLCNQTIVAATLCAVAEAVNLAERGGIDAAALPAALAGGWADSVLLQTFVPRMLAGAQHDVSVGALATMLKDVDNVATAAQAAGLYAPVLQAVQHRFRQAQAEGLGGQDLAMIAHVTGSPA